MKVTCFVKNWALPLSMIAGVISYFGCAALPLDTTAKTLCLDSIAVIQPSLIFLMLFITFCKVDISEMRLRGWHIVGILLQAGLFCGLAVCSLRLDDTWRVITEGAMVCLICPTATAAAVVTRKLGGSAGGLSTYTLLINITTALVVSSVVPLLHPAEGMSFWTNFTLINAKIMPLLFIPIVAALVVRRWWKRLPETLKEYPDLAFYLWCFALTLAIAITVRSIVRSDYPVICEAGIAAASALACVLQFAAGRWMGGRYDDETRITAGQSLGQKNTVFAIWMGYTFFDPVTSIAGGFYSIWHNLFNSWQLYKQRTAL